MVGKIIEKGKKLFFSQQSSVLSAATLIMLMIVASRILGLLRQRVLAHYFIPDQLSLFFAAFRLPDTLFEVLVFGTFSSAFIPVFTKALQKGKSEAWKIAATVTNIGLFIFLILAAVIILFANQLYGLFAPGFGLGDRATVVLLARILFAAQGFFVVSYILTGVLESLRRFLIPALAPLFYNLGIILGTFLFAEKLGLLAPALGVVIGAATHFLIQLPLAIKLGFKFRRDLILTPEVKKIGKLALPRIVEVSFLQVAKTVELYLASIISVASYTYFTFGNTLQLLPVGIFGTAISKAALPTLSRQSENFVDFKKTLFNALNQISFLVIPISTVLIVLRIPIVRLVYGTDIFGWEATVQTGMVLSAFALSIFFQSAASLLARAFYALHDTKTPVAISVSAILINISIDFVLIKGFGFPAWGLAMAFTIGSFIQTLLLFVLLNKRLGDGIKFRQFIPLIKSLISSFVSGGLMYFLLKIFDRSVWVKRMSFLGRIENVDAIHFEKFVLDTRYTINLFALTVFVVALGLITYISVSFLLKSQELRYFLNMLSRIIGPRRLGKEIAEKEQEPLVPPTSDSAV